MYSFLVHFIAHFFLQPVARSLYAGTTVLLTAPGGCMTEKELVAVKYSSRELVFISLLQSLSRPSAAEACKTSCVCSDSVSQVSEENIFCNSQLCD